MTEFQKNKIDECCEKGLTISETADVMGLSVSAIKSYLSRKNETFCKYCGAVLTQTEGHKEKHFCNQSCYQMAKTSQKSNTSVQQLGEAILVCGGTASLTGQDLDVINTALGVMADNGIKGSEGGTKLRNVLLSLSSPTKNGAAELERLGVSIYDAEGNMRQLDAIMGDLNKALSSLSQEEKTAAISTIFNKRDIAAVNALLESTNGRFAELDALIKDSAGAAEKVFIVMSEPPPVFREVIREIPGQDKAHGFFLARGKAHRAAKSCRAELFGCFMQTILSAQSRKERRFFFPIFRKRGLCVADAPQNGCGEWVLCICVEKIVDRLIGQRIRPFGDVGRRRAGFAVGQTSCFTEAEQHGFLADAECVVIEDVFPDEAPVISCNIAFFAVADADAHFAAVRRVALLRRTHRDADAVRLCGKRVPAAAVVTELRHKGSEQAHRQRVCFRVLDLEIHIKTGRGGDVRPVRYKRRDGASRQPAGQSVVLVLKRAHGEPPVKTDPLDRLAPGKYAICKSSGSVRIPSFRTTGRRSACSVRTQNDSAPVWLSPSSTLFSQHTSVRRGGLAICQ